MTSRDTKFTQGPAQGEHEPGDHAKNVEEETAAHGLTSSIEVDLSPGAGQGGPAGPTPAVK